MDNTLKMSLLFDFYGPLLTERQQHIFEMYFHDDLSLGEISEQLAISRQAVYDMLKRSAAILEGFEQKLSLVAKHYQQQDFLQEVSNKLQEIEDSLQTQDITAEAVALNKLQERIKQILADS